MKDVVSRKQMTAAVLAVSKHARYLMPRACLWVLGKGDRVVDVSHCERWRDASSRALGERGVVGRGRAEEGDWRRVKDSRLGLVG